MASAYIDLSPAYRALAATPVVSALTQCVASSYALEALARNAHWNVEAPTFREFHKTFGDIYEDAGSAVDDLAERIRQLGAFVPVNLATFQSSSGITLPAAPQTAENWLAAIIAGLMKVIADLGALKTVAGAADLDTQDLGIEYSRIFSKHLWMVKATVAR